jgi:hypothetical protein
MNEYIYIISLSLSLARYLFVRLISKCVVKGEKIVNLLTRAENEDDSITVFTRIKTCHNNVLFEDSVKRKYLS